MAERDPETNLPFLVRTITLGILHDRTQRRKFVLQLLVLLLGLVVIGFWPMASWLGGNVWRFLIWWGFVAFLTVWIVLFAIYDMLRVVREERDKVLSEIKPED